MIVRVRSPVFLFLFDCFGAVALHISESYLCLISRRLGRKDVDNLLVIRSAKHCVAIRDTIRGFHIVEVLSLKQMNEVTYHCLPAVLFPNILSLANPHAL